MISIPKIIANSIQNKLFSSFLLILFLLAAVVTASFSIIRNLGEASDKILKMNYNSVIASMRMLDALETIQWEFVIGAKGSEVTGQTQLFEAQSAFAQWLGRAKDNITEAGERNIVASIDTLYTAHIGLIQRASSARDASPQTVARLEALGESIRGRCLKLLQINQDAMKVKSNAAQKIARKGTLTLILITALVFILGVALSWGLSRRIVRPIVQLKEATQRIALGDYSVQLKSGSGDELGILVQEFDEMAIKLKGFNDLNIRTIVAEQQKISAILANIQDGIFFVEPDYSVRDVNKAALDAFKLARGEAVGHHFLEIIKQDALFADLKLCLETQKPISYSGQDNILILRKDGKQVFLEYFFSPVLSDRNDLLGALFLLRDVTNLKELDRLKSEFVMIASHELKTPLTSINMSIDLLRESLGKAASAQDLELFTIAKEEINRLRHLINDLLDLSKIEARKIEMHFASVPPSAILNSVAQYFKNQAAELGATLEILDSSSIPNVWCDQEKLLLVFSNLVSNALKAIKTQGRIRITAEKSGDFVLFCVKDNGIGIPLAYQNKIFDRFVQVEDQNAARGTGLGLTISREIVRAHGGSIWVESSPGNGAAFNFTIPTEPAPLAQITKR